MERTSTKTLQTLLKVARLLTGRDLFIETWAPGDGWTRYRIEEDGGSRNVSHYLRKSECELWLRAFIDGAQSVLGQDRCRELYREHGNPWESHA